MEFDVFIPGLALAFEYQGKHHFNSDFQRVESSVQTSKGWVSLWQFDMQMLRKYKPVKKRELHSLKFRIGGTKRSVVFMQRYTNIVRS